MNKEGEDLDVSFDAGTAACALSGAVTSEDKVVGFKMMRNVWSMTDEIWRTNGKS